MGYRLTFYDWSMFTLPADIPMSDIRGDSHANDPASPDYSSGAPTWVGKDYTFNGGTGYDINVDDDDSFFDDGYVDDGSDQTLADAITINGVTYPAGSIIENEFSLLDAAGDEIYVLRINGENVGFVYAVDNEPVAGQTFTSSAGRDGDPLDSADGQSSSTNYSNVDTREGIVDGTQGADLIDASYTDPDGDRVDRFNGAGANNSDIVYAGDGNDTVRSGADTDTVYGGQGDDFIDGGEGHDSLHGGEGADTIYGGIGNDSVEGGAGNDSIHGEAGNDSLYGGAGSDTIWGGDGADFLDGGTGNDALYGGIGNDRIAGRAGNDSIEGGSGSDTLWGGDGADTIRGGADNDSILGGGGNDHLYDDAGADTVHGHAGDDVFFMGAGNDAFYGDTGSDRFIATDGFGQDTITGGEDVGSDPYDFLDFRSHTQSVTVTYTGLEAGSATAGTDTVTFTEIEGIWLSNQSDSVDASANTGFTAIGAGAGDDTIVTGSGNDIVIGEEGNDSIVGNAGSDTLDGGLGSDTIHGGAGGDSLYGGGGKDSILGGDGDDQIYGGTESDRLYGGAGTDFIYGEAGDDRLEGGDGADYLDGGEGNDTLHGDAGNDVIAGGGGDDAAFGGDGNDTIAGGAGTDRLIGGQGSDSVEGGDGNDYLQGDSSTGTSQTDLNSGGAPSAASSEPDGNDTLSGGAGHDTLHGGGGNDLLTGGGGNDFFYVSDGHDTITDFNVGNTGQLGDRNSSNNDFLNLGAYYDSLDELRADQADDGILNQSNTVDDEGNTVDYTNNAQFGTTSSMTVQNANADTYSYDNTGIVCFAAGTRVRTPHGEVAIETLQPGDLVNTLDHGPQPLLWVGRRHVNDAELTANEELRPVLITKGALGNSRELLVSRQHGMLIGSDYFVRAIHLARDMSGVRIAHGKREVTYVHLFFAHHEIVFAEGIPSESFYPGPEALKLMSPVERSEFLRIMPSLNVPEALTSAKVTEVEYGGPARAFVKLSEIRSAEEAAA